MNWNRIAASVCWTLCFSLFLSGTPKLAAKENPPSATCLSHGWPQDRSDLKPDPALRFGTLKNGFRYVIMRNQEPKGRVSLQLDIQTGSLHETEEQRGLAHYLEHMMFNGTTHYPPGEMVEYFQSIGMAFGPDSNAHTSHDETVYELMLPNSAEKTLGKGLQLLADYAGGALLLPKEVDKERGVILAEKRERDSAARRVYKADIEQAFAGTLVAKRDVIGDEAVLKKADAALLRQYYEHWYRPDTMILVAVGDVEPALLEKLISEQFSPLKTKTEQPACPDLGKVTEGGSAAFYQHEPDLGRTEVTIGSVWNIEPEVLTRAVALRKLKETAATTMFNHRLQRLVNSTDSPLISASVYAYRMFQQYGAASLKARTDSDKWQAALELLNTALRQALTAGFAEGELERAKQEIASGLKKQAEAAASRKSDDLSAEFISCLNDNEVPLSPAQELELYGPALKEMTLAEVNEAFRSLWHERRLIKVAGTADLSGGKEKPEALILAAWKAAETAELKPWQQEAKAVFPYLPPPVSAAQVAQHSTYEKIGADRYLFSNGLILNLKKTDFEPKELQVAVAFGKGELSQPKPGLAWLAGMLVPESGVGGLDKEQLKAALAPYSSSVNFHVQEETFQFTGKGLTEETELLFQLLYTHLHDPAFRADAFDRALRKTEQYYAQMQNSVEGMMQLKGEPFLAGGNLRYGLVPLEKLKALTRADVEGWLAPVFSNEPLEISVVGDFDKEQVLKLVGTYFSEERKGSQKAEGEKITFPAGQNLPLNVTTATDKAQITVAWPTEDFWDIARTRRLNMLAAVLDDRLRKQIREELGAAYSPYVYNQSSTVDPGYGVLRGVLLAEPGQAALLADKLKQAGAELASGKVTAEELTRALEPTLTSLRDTVRTNDYWLESVLVSSSRHPQRLEWPETLLTDYASVKAEEIAALAAKYLQPDKAATVILLPEKK
jgi:zinc protease